MNYRDPTFTLLNLEFSYTILLTVTITGILTFLFVYLGAKKAHAGKPTGMQGIAEWLIDFIRDLVGSNIHSSRNNQYIMLGLTFIIFIFIGNFLSIPFKIVTTEYYTLWKSPTSDPHVTLTFSLAVIVLANLFSIRLLGTKEFLNHFRQPSIFMLPLHIVEEFAKTLTLGLRLFGNIFAKETLAGMMATAGGAGLLGAMAFVVPMIAWQAFGLFIGAIQAFIFTVLTIVYISQKVETGH